jgi:predicted ATPase
MMTSFSVAGYKCLRNVKIPLTPIHVVIGQNDSGKTALLESMLALHSSADGPLSDAFPGEWQGRELVNESLSKPQMGFEAEFVGVSEDPAIKYHLEVEFPKSGRKCIAVQKYTKLGGKTFDMRPPPRGGRGSMGNALDTDRIHNIALGRDFDLLAEAMGEAHLYRFDPKSMMLPAVPDTSRTFRMDPDGFGLSTLLDDLLSFKPELFIELRKRFMDYYPEFRNIQLETVTAVARQYESTGRHSYSRGAAKGIFFEAQGGTRIRAQQASDGMILFLGLLGLIYSPKPPRLLLIEEPERGVYPKRLEQVIGLLRELAQKPPGVPIPQIVMTTHSPYLLSLFKPSEVTLMSREGGSGPVRARPLRFAANIDERLGEDEFYLGELWYNLTEEELFADA